LKELIEKELTTILATARKIDYNGIVLYLLNEHELQQVLQLELTVRANEIEKGVKKKNYFYDYAKIINPEHYAFKYTLSMKHKKKEIFDPEKVRKSLPAEFQIWKNKSRVELENEIKNPDSAITDDQAKKLRAELEKEIEQSEKKVQEVLENYDNYDVIITTYEQLITLLSTMLWNLKMEKPKQPIHTLEKMCQICSGFTMNDPFQS